MHMHSQAFSQKAHVTLKCHDVFFIREMCAVFEYKRNNQLKNIALTTIEGGYNDKIDNNSCENPCKR